jgi:hypothetical protein
MKRIMFLVLALTLVSAFAAPARAAYNFTTIDFPSAFSTTASGISGSTIVGYYQNAAGTYGFLYNGTSYSTLNAPGAHNSGSSGTYAFAVSGSNIVGIYNDASGNVFGFLYNGSSYSPINVPGSSYTTPFGISGSTIVGYYADASGTFGFLDNGGSYSTITVPGATGTYTLGVSGGNISGYYTDAAGYHGFIYSIGTGTFSFFGVPSAPNYTFAEGMSGNTVAGGYYDSIFNMHGFVYNGSTFTTVDVPGSAGTLIYGIDGSNIVGFYNDSLGGTHGFLGTPVPIPSALLLFAPGLAGLASFRFSRRAREHRS